jgi:hypothetical protein
MSFVGDLKINSVVNKKFTTVDSSGLPTAFTGTPILAAYKNNSTTQTILGITVSTDFDSITGLHNILVDLSQDPTFYAAGCDIDLVILAGTVSAVSLSGYIPMSFSIVHRNNDANLTQIDGLATNGNNATLNLKMLNIINNAGDALVAQSTGGGGNGFWAEGSGSGNGFNIIGGTNGVYGMYVKGQGTGSVGFYAEGDYAGISAYASDGPAMELISNGGGSGLEVTGGGANPAAVFTGDIYSNLIGTVSSLSVTERNEVADAVLNRDMSTGTDSGSATVRTIRQALRFLRNKWTLSGTTLSVKKEDDSTESWTAVVGTTPSSDGIISVDPASS